MKEAVSAGSFDSYKPDEQLLIDRLVHALTFAKSVVQHLLIEGHSAPEDAPWYVRPEKIIAETAFLIAFTKANKFYSAVRYALNDLAEALIPLARSKSMLLNISLKPGLALDYAHAHICLHYAGYPDEKFDKIVIAALQSMASDAVERTPYRMLEREWLRSIWKDDYEGNLKLWIPLSCLKHPVDLFSDNTDGAYAITHAVMYASFGRGEIPDVDVDELFQIIETLLIRYMDEQNYDIAGELLMAWPLLQRAMDPIAAFALDCLFKIEAKVGFLPSPGLDTSMLDPDDQIARRTYIYNINYHTALVMGLLCNCLLTNTNRKDVIIKNAEYPNELKNILIKEFHFKAHLHWVELFMLLDKSYQEQLVPWLYQVCLIRRIKEKKYGSVKKILELSGNEFDKLVVNQQAYELLQRLAGIADIKG